MYFVGLGQPQPLNVDIAVSYIMSALEEFDEVDKELIRMRLKRSSLLLFQDDEGGCFIRLHQVVHDAIKTVTKECPESQTNEVISGVITSFNEFIGATPPENKRQNTRHIAPHLKALTMVTDKLFLRDNFFEVHDKDIFEKCKNLGNICEMHGEFEGAKTYFEYSLSFKLQVLGPEHVDVATNYSDLAWIYMELGVFKQAKEYQQRALVIQLDKLGQEHVDVSRSYNNLALIYQNSGDFKQAKEYPERALVIQLDKLGQEHVDVAKSYYNFALIYVELGDFEQAKEYQQRSLVIQLDKLGPEHVDVATSYNNLALIYQNLGDFKQAKDYQERALVIQLDKLGPEHVDVARSYNNLALIYQDLGDFEQARQYQQLALAIREDEHGRNKTPNEVRTANRCKNCSMEIMFLLERFYAAFKDYCIGTVSLKFVKI